MVSLEGFTDLSASLSLQKSVTVITWSAKAAESLSSSLMTRTRNRSSPTFSFLMKSSGPISWMSRMMRAPKSLGMMAEKTITSGGAVTWTTL